MPNGFDEQAVRALLAAEWQEKDLPFSVRLAAQVVRGTTNKYFERLPPERFAQFINFCLTVGADPTIKDVVLTGFDGKNGLIFSEITTVDFMRQCAQQDPSYAGEGEAFWMHTPNGPWLDYPPLEAGLKAVAVKASVARVLATGALFATTKVVTNAAYMVAWSPMWQGPMHPYMLAKCAYAAALRAAFPKRLGKLYIREEMNQAGVSFEEAEKKTEKADAEREDLIGVLVDAGLEVVATPVDAEPKVTATSANATKASPQNAAAEKGEVLAWLQNTIAPILGDKKALDAAWKAVPPAKKMKYWDAYQYFVKNPNEGTDAAITHFKA